MRFNGVNLLAVILSLAALAALAQGEPGQFHNQYQGQGRPTWQPQAIPQSQAQSQQVQYQQAQALATARAFEEAKARAEEQARQAAALAQERERQRQAQMEADRLRRQQEARDQSEFQAQRIADAQAAQARERARSSQGVDVPRAQRASPTGDQSAGNAQSESKDQPEHSPGSPPNDQGPVQRIATAKSLALLRLLSQQAEADLLRRSRSSPFPSAMPSWPSRPTMSEFPPGTPMFQIVPTEIDGPFLEYPGEDLPYPNEIPQAQREVFALPNMWMRGEPL